MKEVLGLNPFDNLQRSYDAYFKEVRSGDLRSFKLKLERDLDSALPEPTAKDLSRLDSSRQAMLLASLEADGEDSDHGDKEILYYELFGVLQ